MKLNKIIVILGFYGSQLKEYGSLVVLKPSLATLRDHATGNPPAEAIFKLFATWHEHVRAVWAYDDVCNGLDHNVS